MEPLGRSGKPWCWEKSGTTLGPDSGWPPKPVKNCILGGKVLFCLDPALVLAQKPSRHLPTAPDSVPTCWPRITRDGMDVYDLKFLTNNNEYIIGICVSVSISGS